jgi:hypothetical protein
MAWNPHRQAQFKQLTMQYEKMELYSARSITMVIIMLELVGCGDSASRKINISHQGSYTIKESTANNMRNGKTEIYDQEGKLASVVNYKDDLKSGFSVDYYSNGVMADSGHYEFNKRQRYWKYYREDGRLLHVIYYYFGLQFGPSIWYQSDGAVDKVLRNFKFFDFDGHCIAECYYNKHGNIDSITNFALPIELDSLQKNGDPFVRFFAYLPVIPLVKETYYIGIADSVNISRRKLCDIQGSNFFIDTILAPPPPGCYFYLASDLKADEIGLDTTFITEARQNRNRRLGNHK